MNLVVLTPADQVANRVGGDHNLNRRVALAIVGRGNQLLGDHSEESERDLLADLRLVSGRERIQNAGDGLRGIVGMQRGEHQMPGLGRSQNSGDGLRIAHLADQNHIRSLTQNAAHGAGEIRSIAAHLNLLDDGAAIGVHEFNGILDSHDVIPALGIDQVNECG